METVSRRSEFIENEIAIHKEMSDKAAMIQEKYDSLKYENEKDVSDLIMLLDEYSSFIVKRMLSTSLYYSRDNMDDIIQTAREAVVELIKKDKTRGITKIANYVCGIYQRKAADFFRLKSKHDHASLDEEIGDEDYTLEKIIPVDQPSEPWLDDERKKLFRGLLNCTCRAILYSKEYPPYSLAVIYAQVISHIDDSIPPYKKSSAKWAYNVMGKKTVEVLGTESEETVNNSIIGRNLFWGKEFYDQLNKPPKEDCGVSLLREVIYTKVYTQDKVDKFVSNYQRGMFNRIIELYKEDKELMELVSAHLSDRDHTFRVLLNGGKR